MKKKTDLVEEVRERAMRISQRHGHDLHRYCDYLREKERQHPDRVVSQPTVVPSPQGRRKTG